MQNDLKIAYIHIAEADWDDAPVMSAAFKEAFRIVYSGAMIYSGHYNLARGGEAVRRGWADLVGFGCPFIANPDLPWRLQRGSALNVADLTKFFGGGAEGYIDYPLSCYAPAT